MASGYEKAGTDLDSILAAFVSGQTQAAATGYKVAGSDFNTRYAKLSYGTAPAVTGYKVASSDLSTIFAGIGTVITSLTLYMNATATGTLANSYGLVTTVPASEVSKATSFITTAAEYGRIDSQGGSVVPSSTIPAPAGYGFLFDSTILEGHTLKAGTWTLKFKASSVIGATDTVNIKYSFFKYNAGVYTALGGLAGNHGITSSVVLYTVSPALTSDTAFVTGDKLYLNLVSQSAVLQDLTSSSPFTFYTNGGTNESIATTGYA